MSKATKRHFVIKPSSMSTNVFCMLLMTDMLPEWSTVDAEEIETGGSFDASGAFLSSKVTPPLSLFTCCFRSAIHIILTWFYKLSFIAMPVVVERAATLVHVDADIIGLHSQAPVYLRTSWRYINTVLLCVRKVIHSEDHLLLFVIVLFWPVMIHYYYYLLYCGFPDCVGSVCMLLYL